MNNFGDSITVGVGASPSTKSWVGLLAPVNKAVSGSQAADVANVVTLTTPNVSDGHTLMIGTNDVRLYKDNASKQAHFKRFLRHCIAWLHYPAKVLGINCTFTGTWSNTTVNSIGKNSTQNGATAKATVTGDKIYIGYIIQNSSAAISTADVYVDNVLVGVISCDGITAPMNTGNGATYAAACECFEVGAGAHEVRLVVTSTNKYFYLNYILGNNQVVSKLLVSNIIKYSDAAYITYGVSEIILNKYNNIINLLSAEFALTIVDNKSDIVPSLHLADGIHPNNAGHEIIYNNFKKSL